MLLKMLSLQGIRSFEPVANSNTSSALSSNALKRGCSSKLTLITNLLHSSPTYTTTWPLGTSFGIEYSSSVPLKQHNIFDSSICFQAAFLRTLVEIFRHFWRHRFKNSPFTIIFVAMKTVVCMRVKFYE